jgi:predicted anti-sigma-YlaC factor YlaD
MDCRAARRFIPAFLDGELQPGREVPLKEHLDLCGSCRAEMVALRRTMDAMGACQDLEPAFALADIKARATERQTRRGWFSLAPRWATALGAAVAIFVGTVGGIGLQVVHQSSTQPPAVSRAVSDVLGLGTSDDPLADLMVASASEHSTIPGNNGQEGRP